MVVIFSNLLKPVIFWLVVIIVSLVKSESESSRAATKKSSTLSVYNITTFKHKLVSCDGSRVQVLSILIK